MQSSEQTLTQGDVPRPGTIWLPESNPTAVSPALSLARELTRDLHHPLLVDYPEAVSRILLQGALEEGMTGRSVLNAHIPGMASLILWDREQTSDPGDPLMTGGKIRLFITERDTDLNSIYEKKYGPGGLNDPRRDFNCGPHDHRYGLAVVPLVGALYHLQTEEATRKTSWTLNKFRFTPALEAGQYGFEHIGREHLVTGGDDLLEPGDVHIMDSRAVHSVAANEVGHSSVTAWLTIEAPKEDKPYLIYSMQERPLKQADSEDYKKASQPEVERLIGQTLELMQQGTYL